MRADEFADALRRVSCPTPLTDAFEAETDAYNQRKYGQKDNRWWDASSGSQKEHLICWYARKYCGGSTVQCIEENAGTKCQACCFVQQGIFPEGYGGQRDAETVFIHMGRPEMFLYIAEAFSVMPEQQLKAYVQETKDAMDQDGNWRRVREKYLSWQQVEEKAAEILKQQSV